MRLKLIYVLAICYCIGFAQNRTKDSLLSLLKFSKEDTTKINLLNSLGKTFISKGLYLTADSIIQEALSLSLKLKFNAGQFNSLTNSGVTFWYQGNFPRALDNYFKALRLAEEMKNKFNVSRCLANIGLVYFSQKDYIKALDYYFRALKIKEEIGDKRAVAILISNIGQVYYEKKDYQNALSNYFKALKLDEEVQQNKGLIALNYSNIANVYRALKNDEKVLEFSQKALVITKEINDKVLFSTVSCNLGSLYLNKHDFLEAEKHLQNAFKTSTDIGDLNNKKDALKNLSELYALTKRWDLSFERYKEFIATRDNIYNEENTKQTVKLEMNYEFDKIDADNKAKQDKKDALNRKEKEKQSLIRNSFIVGFGFIGVFAILIFRGYKNKQKANLIITKQKEEVEKSKHIIEEQKKVVEEKQKEVLDSIRYAHRIQKALITNEIYIEKNLNKLIKD